MFGRCDIQVANYNVLYITPTWEKVHSLSLNSAGKPGLPGISGQKGEEGQRGREGMAGFDGFPGKIVSEND